MREARARRGGVRPSRAGGLESNGRATAVPGGPRPGHPANTRPRAGFGFFNIWRAPAFAQTMLKIVLIARVIERVESNVRFDARIGKRRRERKCPFRSPVADAALASAFPMAAGRPACIRRRCASIEKTSISLRRKCANSRFGDNPVDRFECALSTAGTRPPVLKRSASVSPVRIEIESRKKQKRPIRAAWTRAGESAHGANEDEKNGHA